MTVAILTAYVTQTTETRSISRIIEFDNQLLMDLILQGVNTVILIVLVVLMIRLLLWLLKS